MSLGLRFKNRDFDNVFVFCERTVRDTGKRTTPAVSACRKGISTLSKEVFIVDKGVSGVEI